MINRLYILVCMLCILTSVNIQAQIRSIPKSIVPLSSDSYQNAKPWVVWYFMHASYSKEGIKADLEAMAANNIAGAYFTPIKDKTDPLLFSPATKTLTPEWWDMFRYMVEEAKKLNIQIAMFPNDGFATAGGPWIKPEQSMQKIVWTDTVISSTDKAITLEIPQAKIIENYYKDLKVVAIPLKREYRLSTTEKVKVTSSYNQDLSRIAVKGNETIFASSEPGWIQYEFTEIFPCNSLKIDWKASNYQVNRFKILASNDGINFDEVVQLKAPRTGWLDWDNGVTHTIPFTKAKFFRFVYDSEGSEPGAEDLDVAKWKPSIKFTGITLFEEPKITNIEGKNGEIWRVSPYTTPDYVEKSNIINSNLVIDLTASLDNDGILTTQLPLGNWKILRIGHTSTGHKNETAGAGKGLEADKLDSQTMAYQFEQWYGRAKKSVPDDLSKDVLTVYHIDSWECGSQNWTRLMEEEFKKRRKYDIDKYWPVLAGLIVNSVDESEAFLSDYRLTLAELLDEKCFGTLKKKADEYAVKFTAETTAPVMASDGLSHFSWTDNTMGEFWYRSPSHDKPNDILDAISAGHIYGKNILMSEAFTQIRMQWDEHPRLLKTLQDRNYAIGVNSLVYHVYTHNPWLDRKPGMTLDGVGIFFQRDQTWWNQGKEWVNYAIRNQQLLQHGKPVRDIAVFIGEEIPRRSILPNRLVNVIPGLLGGHRVALANRMLANKGIPMQKFANVSTTKNMYNPEEWVDPLQGYAYDSFNPDVLINNTKVVDGNIVMSDHITYKLLVVPSNHTLNHRGNHYTLSTLRKLVDLIENGGNVLFEELPKNPRGILSARDSVEFLAIIIKLSSNLQTRVDGSKSLLSKQLGKGKLFVGTVDTKDLSFINLHEDVIINHKNNTQISWNHRTFESGEIYFLASQDSVKHNTTVSFREYRSNAYIYDPLSDDLSRAKGEILNGRFVLDVEFDVHGSFYIIFSDEDINVPKWKTLKVEKIKSNWEMQILGISHAAVKMKTPTFWTNSSNTEIKYHSGEGIYTADFQINKPKHDERVLLQLSEVESMAEVSVNGNYAGVIWANPFQLDISKLLNSGKNKLEIKVVNTWGNRFLYESENPNVENKKIKTTAPNKFLKGLLPSGLNGEVKLIWQTNN
ncbi:glycosyl hydrolase [Sphingobacterium bovistauri]|uniref:DNA-binding protein n=1 Tax=Sphingobacterium bovistauri TaxID=2781959 RepID=A0ABS7Z3I1_9SPHI|nr:glycosyl hydrolase [Sphingobacterium bovistauri]MCA5004740.1 DNA-binding protein [Sphingobacterium bovistauri]